MGTKFSRELSSTINMMYLGIDFQNFEDNFWKTKMTEGHIPICYQLGNQFFL